VANVLLNSPRLTDLLRDLSNSNVAQSVSHNFSLMLLCSGSIFTNNILENRAMYIARAFRNRGHIVCSCSSSLDKGKR
jgi:hypothetical protein